MQSLVSVITPTVRAGMLEKCIDYFKSQDYPNKEIIIIPGEGSIGEKRNRGCAEAKGDIIVHFDDDDYYAPDYITKSVEHLQSTQSRITGLSSAYFYDKQANNAYLWEYHGGMPYVCEATMCYYREVWQKRQFRHINSGEGQYFLAHQAGVSPHKHITSFVANLHGNNTASHLAVKNFRAIDVNIVLKVLNLHKR